MVPWAAGRAFATAVSERVVWTQVHFGVVCLLAGRRDGGGHAQPVVVVVVVVVVPPVVVWLLCSVCEWAVNQEEARARRLGHR